MGGKDETFARPRKERRRENEDAFRVGDEGERGRSQTQRHTEQQGWKTEFGGKKGDQMPNYMYMYFM